MPSLAGRERRIPGAVCNGNGLEGGEGLAAVTAHSHVAAHGSGTAAVATGSLQGLRIGLQKLRE